MFEPNGLFGAASQGIKEGADMFALKSLLDKPKDMFEFLLYGPDAFGMDNTRRAVQNGTKAGGFLRYPSDLLTNPEHQLFMQIDIHEPDQASLMTNRTKISKDEFNIPGDDRNILERMKRLGGTGSTGGPSIDLGKITNFLGDVGGNLGAAVGGAVLSLAGPAVRAFMPPGTGKPPEGYQVGPFGNRLTNYVEEETVVPKLSMNRVGGIYLYMPSVLDVNYGVEYEDENLAGMDMLKLGPAILGGEPMKKYAEEIAKKIGFANLKAMNAVGNLIPGFDGNFQKFVSAQSRQVVNPMTVHLFKEVKRREFTFPYTFLPRNAEESHQVQRIINTLKYYSHPARSREGRFLDYPAEFVISFYETGGSQMWNYYLPQIQKCVLKSIKVKYGEETNFSTFVRDEWGSAPTKITMELTFGELEILMRERFADGFSEQTPWGA